MTELREKIIAVLLQHTDSEGYCDSYHASADILAIPEIAEALDARALDRALAAEVRKSLGHSISTNPPR